MPFGIPSVFSVIYSCQTSFRQKYGHFSFLCKQMDIFLGKRYMIRKVTSGDVNRMRRVLKVDFRSTFYEISCTGFGLLHMQIKNIVEIS